MQKVRTIVALLVLVGMIGITIPAPVAQAAVSNWQQKGVSFYPHSPNDFASDGFRANVNHFKSLGMDTVTLIVQLYQTNLTSTDIGAGGNTPTDASIVSAIQYAHSQGLKVMLKVHLDSYDGQWRARINPSNRTTWYANYLNQLTHYGQIAQANNAEFYCLGTELIDMSSSVRNADNTPQWQNMIAHVRQIYHGQLTYDANWGSDQMYGEARFIQFWPQLDFIGVSAYYPLQGDGSVAQNENGWSGWESFELQSLHDTWNKPIVFTEIGYRSNSGAHAAPYDSWSGGTYDPQGQVNAYQALFDYWNSRPYMQGVDMWYADSNPSGGGTGDTDYLPLNKPAEQTLTAWWVTGQNSSSTPPAPAPAFTLTGSASPASVAPSQPVAFSVTANDTGGPAFGTNVDLEIYDNTGHLMAQKIYSSQNFSAGQSQAFALNWAPPNSGTYTFKTGIFDSNWGLYTWNNNTAQVSVGSTPPPPPPPSPTPPPPPPPAPSPSPSPSPAPAPTPSPSPSPAPTPPPTPPIATSTPPGPGQVTNIWWPSNGVSVTGVQPFKAMLESLALNMYQMFWQVDGGTLNLMSDSQTDYPHKEVLVDVTGWNWKNTGTYTINFLSKNLSGTIIDQKSTTINVTH
jgi:hypothetical protein